MINRGRLELATSPTGRPEALSESPRCNDMVADLHFPRFFGTAIKCEIARRFPRSVVKVGPHVQCKNISISSGIQNHHISIHNMWAVQILKRGIGKTRCKPMRNLAKIQMSPKRFRIHPPPPPISNFMMLKYLIQEFHRYSKNYGSLTHETRIKDAVNMEDLICLLATVRTFNTLWIVETLTMILIPPIIQNVSVLHGRLIILNRL